MAKKPHQNVGDYVTMAISPTLIIALITSLVFFLIDILYPHAAHGTRLRWTLFWFIFGIVWVARISMHPAVGERAKIYGVVLSLAVWVGLQRFLVIDELEGLQSALLRPFDWAILLGFFALIWWCAYRLTWDCTFIDDAVDAGGAGVLEAAGLKTTATAREAPRPAEQGKPAPPSRSWWERYQQYRDEQRRKPHTPGVWVVYFSLAALPLFGLGQALLPVEAAERRQFAFWMLGIYTFSGLGLLLTTCYLGLRRYLRQRKLTMPAAMTGMWLTVGGGLIVAMLTAAALLPRPQMEFSLFWPKTPKSSDLQASEHAQLSGETGKGEGKPGETTPADDAKAASAEAKTKEKGGGEGNTKGGGRSGSKDRTGNNQDGKGDGKNNVKSDMQKGKTETNPRDAHSSARPTQGKQEATAAENRSQSSSRPAEPVSPTLGKLAAVLKWVVFGLLAGIFLVVILRSGLQFLANFTDWARRLLESWQAWWNGLFGPADQGDAGEEAAAPAEAEHPRRPFAAFANPFDEGGRAQRSPEEVIRYTFAALDAWATDRDCGRHPEETPREFAARLADAFPNLDADVRWFADLYAAAVYARGTLTAHCLPRVSSLWQQLENTSERVGMLAE